jgi:hypothetical protein
MKSSIVIMALWLGATAWGQVRLPQQQANPAVTAPSKAAPAASSKPSSATPTKPARKAHSTPAKAQHTAEKTAGPKHARSASAARHVSQKASPVASADGKEKIGGKGQRDPFVSPVVDRGHTPIVCTGTGKQCLEVGEVSLHGVVHGASGYIAVVVNGEHTYFLRQNDPLANGQVVRITKDSIVLRERSSDDSGRPTTREVIRKISGPPV